MFGGVNEEMEKEINPTMRDLVELLSSRDDLTRTEACKSLIAIGGPAVPLLVEAIKNSNSVGRWEAAKALDAIGDPATAPALVQALEDEEFEVRWRAAQALVRMDGNGLKPLLQALIKNGDSVLLIEGARHVLRNVARAELRNCLLPVSIALTSTWPSVEVPAAALRAIERLEKFKKTRRGTDATSFNEFTAMWSNRPVNLGARRRARRYARSLQHRTI
jgi:HEAT repeat protein